MGVEKGVHFFAKAIHIRGYLVGCRFHARGSGFRSPPLLFAGGPHLSHELVEKGLEGFF